MANILTMGEIMLRLSPPKGKRLSEKGSFDVFYGGGAANVAVSLARFNHTCSFFTKLPDHDIGDAVIGELKRQNVHTSHILRGNGRLGIYYLEHGAGVRPSQVIYDRQDSVFCKMDPDEVDFDALFQGIDWFHFTGITPALSLSARKLTLKAVQAAKKAGVTISVDLNFRNKLWTEKEAQATMTTLMPYVDVIIGNEEDAEKSLGYSLGKTDVTQGNLDMDAYRELMRKLQKDFDLKAVAFSLRESKSADKNFWSGLIYTEKGMHRSHRYELDIVDRIGGGDAFAAGVIHGISERMDLSETIEFAVASGALKHTIAGDFNLVCVKEVERLMHGDKTGRVKR